VILTNGTFLNGVIHIGERQMGGGRAGERASVGITASLQRMGFETGRLKTGTPPRIDGRTIDYGACMEQPGDEDPRPFSFLTETLPDRQLSCWLTYTSPEVHETLRLGFDRSPMFAGRIQGSGPRYCPSIEDKIDRFADKTQHQLFLEPEGWDTYEVYVNGFSTSLPEEVQTAALRQIPGLEGCHVIRPGYAIEYDYFPPINLSTPSRPSGWRGSSSLDRSTGPQATRRLRLRDCWRGSTQFSSFAREDPLVLPRSEAYLGVLVDDLVAKGDR
jgi:tRNA uridine 5-carboxymethylaminomethyl modification enzyme